MTARHVQADQRSRDRVDHQASLVREKRNRERDLRERNEEVRRRRRARGCASRTLDSAARFRGLREEMPESRPSPIRTRSRAADRRTEASNRQAARESSRARKACGVNCRTTFHSPISAVAVRGGRALALGAAPESTAGAASHRAPSGVRVPRRPGRPRKLFEELDVADESGAGEQALRRDRD